MIYVYALLKVKGIANGPFLRTSIQTLDDIKRVYALSSECARSKLSLFIIAYAILCLSVWLSTHPWKSHIMLRCQRYHVPTHHDKYHRAFRDVTNDLFNLWQGLWKYYRVLLLLFYFLKYILNTRNLIFIIIFLLNFELSLIWRGMEYFSEFFSKSCCRRFIK